MTPASSQPDAVSLVIPGRNCAATVAACLEAVVPMLTDDASPLAEIIFVDDGSTDDTASIVERFDVTILRERGRGAGAARNLGWRAAANPIVWFIDSDCVAEPDALERLVSPLDDPDVGGAGGSYANMQPVSLLACLIHEEIVERHRRMPDRVDFLGGFNSVYRRSVLEEIRGFDTSLRLGQDADLAWRVNECGHALAFVIDSRVAHFHPTSWTRYLIKQGRQGFWRVRLHLGKRRRLAGDAYSGAFDFAQPPLAMLTLATLPLAAWPMTRWTPVVLLAFLLLTLLPMTARLVRRLRHGKYLAYMVMGAARAVTRGIGMSVGLLTLLGGAREAGTIETDHAPNGG